MNVLLEKYKVLHDRLSDMIEDGRLREGDIPKDYRWLVGLLEDLSGSRSAQEDVRFPISDWKYEDRNGDTKRGYWDWVAVRREQAADEKE